MGHDEQMLTPDTFITDISSVHERINFTFVETYLFFLKGKQKNRKNTDFCFGCFKNKCGWRNI